LTIFPIWIAGLGILGILGMLRDQEFESPNKSLSRILPSRQASVTSAHGVIVKVDLDNSFFNFRKQKIKKKSCTSSSTDEEALHVPDLMLRCWRSSRTVTYLRVFSFLTLLFFTNILFGGSVQLNITTSPKSDPCVSAIVYPITLVTSCHTCHTRTFSPHFHSSVQNLSTDRKPIHNQPNLTMSPTQKKTIAKVTEEVQASQALQTERAIAKLGKKSSGRVGGVSQPKQVIASPPPKATLVKPTKKKLTSTTRRLVKATLVESTPVQASLVVNETTTHRK
jgi:hypothetical protein